MRTEAHTKKFSLWKIFSFFKKEITIKESTKECENEECKCKLNVCGGFYGIVHNLHYIVHTPWSEEEFIYKDHYFCSGECLKKWLIKRISDGGSDK